MVTSADKTSVFAMMGPYSTEADAVSAADAARVPLYHVARSKADLRVDPDWL
jgi:hypothetical protein